MMCCYTAGKKGLILDQVYFIFKTDYYESGFISLADRGESNIHHLDHQTSFPRRQWTHHMQNQEHLGHH